MAKSMLDKPEEVPQDSQEQQEPAKQRGCMFWGCITAAILAVVAVVGIGIASYSMIKYAKTFTSETPAEIAVYDPAEGEYEAVKARIEEFKEAVESGTSGVELVLTGDDINTLIASEESLKELGLRAYVKIEGDRITSDVSLPLDELPGFSGLYLNGSADVKASMEDGILFVTLDRLVVNGKEVPEKFMEGIRQKNLVKGLYENGKNVELLRKVSDVRVENGKLVLVSR